MNLMYQTIALILWVLFISWLIDDAEAKRYKHKRRNTKSEKAISNFVTGLAVGGVIAKPIKNIRNDD